MNVEIHVNNVKSQIVPLLPDGSRVRFPKTTTKAGKEIDHPIVRALDKELQYEVEGMMNGVLQRFPCKRFSVKTYKFDTGCLSYVTKVLRTFQQPFKIVDRRIPVSPGETIPLREGVEARPYQEEATKAALKTKRGVLKLATGAGKTFIAWDIIRQINTPTVVFVHTIDLLEQFKEAGEFFLNTEVGQIGNGIVDIKTFTVCMMQTTCLAFNQKYVSYEVDPEEDYAEDSKEYSIQQKQKIRECVERAKVIISDECFIAGTLVLNAVGIPKAIEDYVESDKVCSYLNKYSAEEISNPFSRISEQNHIIQTSSTIHTTSSNHQWWVYNPKIEDFCKRASKDLKKGEYLLSVEKTPHTVLNDFSEEQACFLALIACDGHSERDNFTIKIEASKDVEYFRKAIASARAIKEVRINERESVRSKENIKWKDTTVFSFFDEEVQKWLVLRGVPKGDKSALIDIPDEIFVAPLTTIAKFLNTVYCCEGSIGERRISLQMTSKIFIKKVQLLLLKFGIHTKYQELDYKDWNTKYQYNTRIHYRLDICNRAGLIAYAKDIGFDIQRKQNQLEELLEGYTSDKELLLGNSLICKYVESFNCSVVNLWLRHKIPLRYPKQNTKDTLSRDVFRRVLNLFEEEEHSIEQQRIRDKLLTIFSYRYDKICKVEEFNEPLTVHDFTVNNTHRFIAQTNITSNCHHLSCKTLQTLFKAAKNAYYRYGLTATLREDGADLVVYGVTGRIIYEVTASYLIEHDPPYLVRPYIYYLKVPRPKGSPGKYQERYRDDIVEYEPRNALAAQSIMRLVKKRFRVLVLARQIKHLKILKKLLEEGYESKWEDIKEMDSSKINLELATGQINKNKRKDIIQAMRDNNLECMLASTIADEGLDCPPISAVILVGGGKSATKAFQRVGRALRLYEDKDKAVIIDFYDQGKYFKKHAERRMELFKREPAFVLKIQK